MGKKAKEGFTDTGPHRKSRTVEGRESQCIALAYDLVEKRLREGTATSQEIVHFLRMGAPQERKKAELLDKQMRVLDAKAEAYESSRRMESLYADAIEAVTKYRSSVPRTGDTIDDLDD